MTDAVWIAIMAQVAVFATIKRNAGDPNLSASLSALSVAELKWESSVHIRSASTASTTTTTGRGSNPQHGQTPVNQTQNLPHEIISAIIEKLGPSSLTECALVSRRWNHAATPILYGNAFLPSISSIWRFLSVVENNKTCANTNDSVGNYLHWKYHTITRSVTFGRGVAGLEQGGAGKSNEDIIKTQSSLFRLMVTDRSNSRWTFLHPVLMRLVNVCERLQEAHEYTHDARKKKTVRRRNTNGAATGQWHIVMEGGGGAATTSVSQPITPNPPSQQGSAATSSPSLQSWASNSGMNTPVDALMDPDRLLTNLVRFGRRVVALCGVLGVEGVDTLVVFLGILDTFENLVWRHAGISERGFVQIKVYAFDKLRGILNAISNSILIEVQYGEA
ncbi:hypothetical protein HDU98_008561 [Podochytrium sp. JEL0797]|nr:hypothetical protein HDU98_008561 [Podochytrium sp. JEL0797]